MWFSKWQIDAQNLENNTFVALKTIYCFYLLPIKTFFNSPFSCASKMRTYGAKKIIPKIIAANPIKIDFLEK